MFEREFSKFMSQNILGSAKLSINLFIYNSGPNDEKNRGCFVYTNSDT